MRRVLLYIIWCSCLWVWGAVAACADNFIHLDWTTLTRDSLLPPAHHFYELGADWQSRCYRVKIEYPEYEPLTPAELGVVRKRRMVAGDTLQYTWQVGVSRKEGVGELNICPLLCRDGEWQKLVSYRVRLVSSPVAASRSMRATTSAASRYAAHSVLCEGRWVKIRVADEGIYQLSAAQLKQMGFNDLSRVKVYGYGGRVQKMAIAYTGSDADTDDLEEVPLLRRTGDVLFFANGTLRWTPWAYSSQAGRYISEREINPYSSYSYYFVTEGDDARSVTTAAEVSAATGEVVTTYPERLLIENDVFSWFTSGRHLFDSYNFSSGLSKSYTLSTPQRVADQKAWLTVRMSAHGTVTEVVTPTLNGQSLKNININSSGQYDHAITSDGNYQINLPVSTSSGTSTATYPLIDGENTLSLRTTKQQDARLDYICLNYDRTLRLNTKFLVFSHYLTGNHEFLLEGADANTRIWRIGEAGDEVKEIPVTLDGGRLRFCLSDATRRYVAFNTAATFPAPEVVGRIDNQDLHADSTAQMVIIIPASGKLMEQARRLADYHAEEGLSVRIVRADHLYNEFSSGTPDLGAYRRYLKMLYDRAETDDEMPRYLLLFGASLWDNRMLTSQTKGLDPDDYLLCYESENSVSEVSSYVSDDILGFLDDGEGDNVFSAKMDLGVGRFPVTTAADAQILVDKSIAYMRNGEVGAWKNTIYMMADDGDSNSHMKDADTVYHQLVRDYPAMSLRRVYWDAYERQTTATGNTYPTVTELLKNAMKKGALVMNYSGHGATYTISHEQVLTLTDFKAFSSARVPMWVVASCELTPFDMPVENIGETAMLNKNGAAVAFYSASRAVYSEYNRYLNRNYMRYVLGKDSRGRRYTIGDAARLAKVFLVSDENNWEQDFTSNKLKYALMGDPALTLRMPTERVVVDEINGQSLRPGTMPQLRAGSIATVKGHIESASGQRLTDYRGTLSLLLQDSQDTITCRNNAGDASKPYVMYERTKTLYEGSDSVRNGSFETRIPIPLDINYTNASGRLSLYAVNREKTLEANGSTEQFTVGGSDQIESADSLGPALFVYLNDPDFRDGGTVNENPYFYAVLCDSDGINTTGIGVGHDLQLTIDHRDTYVLNSYYENDFGCFTRGLVSFPIPTLEAGDHQLYFRAWDLKNHSSSTLLNFRVEPGLRPKLDVSLSNNPASTHTTFLISYDRPEVETRFTVEVYDCFGRLWWTHTETATASAGYHTIPWDLATSSGLPLPSGLYLYRVKISCNGGDETTKTKKLVVRRQ